MSRLKRLIVELCLRKEPRHDHGADDSPDRRNVRPLEPGARVVGEPYWFLFTAFVGANLFQSALTKWCLMEDILRWTGIHREGGSQLI